MKKGTRIFLISLIVILMLAIIAAFTYCTINKYAYADYADITSDTIVNFNQLVSLQNSYNSNITISNNTILINNTLNDLSRVDINSFQFINGNKYYIKLNNVLDKWTSLAANGSAIYYFKNTTYYTCDNNNTINRIYFDSGETSKQVIINIYNLSLMYGVGNEPTEEQCEDIFTSFYAYNKGTPMFFGLNQNDMLQHLEYRINTGILSGFPQYFTNTQVVYDNNGTLILTGVHQEAYPGYFLINLKSTIPIGSIVTINFNSYTLVAGANVGICYANEEERYINTIPQNTNYNSPFSYTFITWEETSGFYLICDAYSTGTIMTIKDATISVQLSSDYQFSLQAQYDLGYNDATTYYTQGYGRTEIWTKGFNEGKAKGLQEANGTFTAMDYVKSAFVTLGDIMNIEVFPNFTIGAFFLLPLITGAIFFIIKISKGG